MNKPNDTTTTYRSATRHKQFWVRGEERLEHKTEVVVKGQMLKHEGYGAYSGYFLVEKMSTGEEYYINVNNFVTKPYWSYDDVIEAARTGCFIAEFNQESDFYPVTGNGKYTSNAHIENGTIVFVRGIDFNGAGSDNKIEGVVYKEWKNGYGGVTVRFNEQDLTIIY